jgi:radical SAM protein with 4Fe4S-binding SPASM domain
VLDREFVPLLAITFGCDASPRCPYCYSRPAGVVESMSLDTFTATAKLFKGAGAHSLTFVGGEPTQHPGFQALVHTTHRLGLQLRVFTNGLFDADRLQDLAESPAVTSVFFHYDPVHTATPGARAERFWQNVHAIALHPRRIDTWLRWNLAAPEADIDAVVARAAKLGLGIGYSISTPDSRRLAPYVPINEHRRFATTILRLCKTADAAGVRLALGRPLPVCMFDEPDRSWMLKRPDFAGSCSALDDVAVYPNGSLQLCSVLLSENVGRPGTLEDLQRKLKELQEREDRIRTVPSLPECRDCELWSARKCQGGCLAFKLYSKESAGLTSQGPCGA